MCEIEKAKLEGRLIGKYVKTRSENIRLRSSLQLALVALIVLSICFASSLFKLCELTTENERLKNEVYALEEHADRLQTEIYNLSGEVFADGEMP